MSKGSDSLVGDDKFDLDILDDGMTNTESKGSDNVSDSNSVHQDDTMILRSRGKIKGNLADVRPLNRAANQLAMSTLETVSITDTQ